MVSVTTKPPPMSTEAEARAWLEANDVRLHTGVHLEFPGTTVAFLYHRAVVYEIAQAIDTEWSRRWRAAVDKIPLTAYWFEADDVLDDELSTSWWGSDIDNDYELSDYLTTWFGDPWFPYHQYMRENFNG